MIWFVGSTVGTTDTTRESVPIACHTNNCPVGIATQKKSLRERLDVKRSARQLQNYLESTVGLMKILARACGHSHFKDFSKDDLTTWKRDVAYLTGISYAGAVPL